MTMIHNDDSDREIGWDDIIGGPKRAVGPATSETTGHASGSALPVKPEGVPEDLRRWHRWVLWKHVVRDGWPTKMPYQVGGAPASSNNPSTWAPFEDVLDVYERGGYDGIGYVFAADGEFCGIDLDGCRDSETGSIAPWAEEIIRRFSSYTEVSPSGTGVKIFVRGQSPFPTGKNLKIDEPAMGGKAAGVEIYDRARYFAVTGRVLEGYAEIADGQDALNWLAKTYWPDRRHPTEPPRSTAPSSRTETSVIERARSYLATIEPAVSGQAGHNVTFRAACKLTQGFGLSIEDALPLMQEWNQGCVPPWSDRELMHKLENAAEADGESGALRDANSGQPADQEHAAGGSGEPGGEAAPESTPSAAQESGPVLTCLADVEPCEVPWLWKGMIPLGRMSLLVGRPGEGKSFFTIDAASRVTTGTPWPDGSDCPEGSVLLLTAEDDPADTIRPRLDAHYADVQRVHLLSAVRRRDEKGQYERLITLADVDAIEAALNRIPDCLLIVVDPIGSFLGGSTDAHRDNEVRSVLGPAAKLAEKYGAALLVVAHRRKSGGVSADDLAMGSRAFTGIARSVLHLSRDPEDKRRRLLLPGKNNLAAENHGMAFAIGGDPPHLQWEKDPVNMHADDALAAEENNRRKPGPEAMALDNAKDWLHEALVDGPRLVKELRDDWTNGYGGSKRTLDRAKQALGVEAFRPKVPGPWSWRLPAKDANAPKGEYLGDLGNLAENQGVLPFSDPGEPKDAKLSPPGTLGGDRTQVTI